jgi:hypothetical protein
MNLTCPLHDKSGFSNASAATPYPESLKPGRDNEGELAVRREPTKCAELDTLDELPYP